MTNKNYEILLRNIEMLMKNNNMIPADLIRATGISQPQVSKALSRTHKAQFTFEQIWTIADYFNVSIDYLVGRRTTVAVTEKSTNKEICKFLMQLIESEVASCSEIEIEENMYTEDYGNFHDYPYRYSKESNQYCMFYFSNYINPDTEGLDEFTLDEIGQNLLINGNYNEKSKEINDFLTYFFKLYDLYKHNNLEREIFDQAISDRLDKLEL